MINVVTDQPPTVSITNPSDGATITGTIIVSGTAHDDNAVQLVEISIDGGAWQVASGTTSWTFSLDTTTLSEDHIQLVPAFDGSQYSSVVSITVNVKQLPTEQEI